MPFDIKQVALFNVVYAVRRAQHLLQLGVHAVLTHTHTHTHTHNQSLPQVRPLGVHALYSINRTLLLHTSHRGRSWLMDSSVLNIFVCVQLFACLFKKGLAR